MNQPPRPSLTSSRRLTPSKKPSVPPRLQTVNEQRPSSSFSSPSTSSSPSKKPSVPPRLQTVNEQRPSSSFSSPSTSSSPSSSKRLPSLHQLSISSPLSSLGAMNPRPSTPLSRLSSFRDLSSIQQALLNRTKTMNKKTYVPHLDCSRNIAPKVKPEENAAPVVPKQEPGLENKETRRGRRERKVLEGVETFVPDKILQKFGASSGIKSEIIDPVVLKRVFDKDLPRKFEDISLSSPLDLPVSIPSSLVVPKKADVEKLDPPPKDVIKFEEHKSSLFLLKTPRYLPRLMDDLKSSSESKATKTKEACSINNIRIYGQIGKLQVLKSGRLRLVLGDCKFSLRKGVDVNFREELASVELDPESKTGNIFGLGEIKGRLMVIPDVITNLNVKDS